MGFRILLLIMGLSVTSCGPSLQKLQEDTSGKQRQFRTLVITTEKTEWTGILLSADSSGITLKQKREHIYIPVKDIWELRFRRKGSVSKGIGIGLLAGAGIGLAVGVGSEPSEPDNIGGALAAGPSKSIAAGASAVGFGILGGLLGGIAGTHNPIKLYIRGNPTNYFNYYNDLRHLSFEREPAP